MTQGEAGEFRPAAGLPANFARLAPGLEFARPDWIHSLRQSLTPIGSGSAAAAL
jgi:hypothetical protein